MELYDYEKKHLRKVRKIASECTLFLKKNNDFPLEEVGDIALYGNGARYTVKGGTGSGEVNSRFSINIEKGLKNAGFNITSAEWLDAYEEERQLAKKKFYDDIRKTAREHHTIAIMEAMGKVMPEPEYRIPIEKTADIAVYVLSRISGEGNDREAKMGDILLTRTEIRDILEINKKYDKFMLVLNVGGPVDLSPVMEVENILLLSELGVVTGKTFAEILTGKAYPSGKLTTTWAKWEDYCKEGNFGDKNDTYYKEGIYVGYRYFDTVGKKALFPFGYGLSYTKFDISDTSVSLEGEMVQVEAEVKNTGDHIGKEVVQVYVSVPAGELDQPYQTLAAFAKTEELKPDESAKLHMSFNMSDLAGYDEKNAQYMLEKGDYLVRVGNSSVNTIVAAVISLGDTVVTRKTLNCLGTAGFEDYRPISAAETEIPTKAARLVLDTADLNTEIVNYDLENEIDQFVDELEDEELALLNVGAFNPHGGITSVVGDASSKVAGAAGQTANPTKDVDFPVMVMSDGPAGLRISRQFYRDANGAHSMGLGIPESFEDMMPRFLMAALRIKEKLPVRGTVHDQYATAIPIGTALAQSFNIDVAEACGDIVGAEMERFGVHLWLAPALNIQRDIRCGRNFEYFSEDPLVSGKFAAAVTKGVQAHKGCGTTIKHYAANNQETNRYNNNSHVSERAMREIYLRGFEICVKEAQPKALMTSYNLLNGQHTSESRGLIEEILRCEFGYKGIVMTDWIVMGGTFDKSSLYRGPKASLIAAAGGDLVMPGGKADVKDILEGLKNGNVTRRQLLINASRVYRMAKELCV